MNKIFLVMQLMILVSLSACDNAATSSTATTPTDPMHYTYRIVNTYPHDREAFTQGLIFHEGALYESTGYWELSSLRKVTLETGEVVRLRLLNKPGERLFGEGLTLWEDDLIYLTWQANKGFVYDLETFESEGKFSYATEGWGITHDGVKLIMSDGTENLYFLNPTTFEEIGRIQVRDGDQPVIRLNELEFINGEIFANVWQTNRIARISPETGQVLGWIDLAGLLSPEDRAQQVDVLNGIAYDAENDRLFVTGKWWPKLFEIELVKQN